MKNNQYLVLFILSVITYYASSHVPCLSVTEVKNLSNKIYHSKERDAVLKAYIKAGTTSCCKSKLKCERLGYLCANYQDTTKFCYEKQQVNEKKHRCN